MRKMTEENMKAAFAGESQAHMKYLIFARKAQKEGYPSLSRLFKAIAFAEQVHAANHLKVLGGINSSAQNLQAAIDGAVAGDTVSVGDVIGLIEVLKTFIEIRSEFEGTFSKYSTSDADPVTAGQVSRSLVVVVSEIQNRHARARLSPTVSS